MARFILQNSLWLVPALLGMLVLSLGALLWVFRVKTRAPVTPNFRDENLQAFLEKSDLEMVIAEQADRMRMIAEVHESAAASLTTMISQAEGAAFTATSDPQVASRAAKALADSARTTLSDVRRVVNSSRGGLQEVEALPSLVSIQDLFSAIRESGIAVGFEETGKPFELAPSAELAIYRILQESLNNARSHGGPGTTAKITLAWGLQGLHVRVEDDGTRTQRRFASDEGAGYTIEEDQSALTEVLEGRGMKDMMNRTEAFGGVFSAHRVPRVGFSVSAAFPTIKFHNGVHGVELRESSSSTHD
jgi:signal transduction histidine kinase